jgi:two-component system response regulator
MPCRADILLVEDNSADAELTMLTLRAEKLANRVDVVQDGAEALDYLFCRNAYSHRALHDMPRLVLLDIKLPKMDGCEVLRELKNHLATKAIPVVIMTSSNEERDLIESYRLGANSYIQKPVDFDQFREVVKQVGLYWLVVNRPAPVFSEIGAAV